MRLIQRKRAQRDRDISRLGAELGELDQKDADILSKPVSALRELAVNGTFSRRDIWAAYTKKAISCHAKTNCLTELVPFDETAHPAKGDIDDQQPLLAGVPVSLKDNFGVAGLDASIGYPSRCGRPVAVDSPLVRLLKDAGAILYTKTNLPTGMLSILSGNPIWGTTANPRDESRGPGGSSSGEGALIGGGGSRIGVGTDIGGSVRIPAHFCGIYSLRMSHNRFPRSWLHDSSTPGFEGIPDVASPMAKTFDDLKYFVESVMAMKPWEYCCQMLPLPWRSASTTHDPKPKRVGIIRGDGFLRLTPPVERALSLVADTLSRDGVEVLEFKLPQRGQVYDQAYTSLILADGFETAAKPLGRSERSDPILDAVRWYSRVPRWLRSLLEWLLAHVLRQEDLAAELKAIGPYSVTRYYEAVVRREELRLEFHQAWKSQALDVLIAPVLPTPALPLEHVSPDSICNYCALFNLLDYPAGVVPVTTVDRSADAVSQEGSTAKLNWQSRSYLDSYDAEAMHGLPVGLQVVGLRYHDEQVLDAMGYLDRLLRK